MTKTSASSDKNVPLSVGQKLVMLKMCSTSFTFLSLRNLKAAPEEAKQLRWLIKSSSESL